MGRYRAKDLLLPPSLLSLSRVPLAAAFVLALDRPLLELAILTLAGLSDVLDGWWARRHGQVTATGAVVDPITDKLFVLTVVVSLVVSDRLAPHAVLLLATRELGEAPLVAWWALSRHRRKVRAKHPEANAVGKLATVLQFATVTLALFRAPQAGALLVVTACVGVLAAISYWRREAARVRRGSERL
jgi:cardiolipin synthase